MRAQHREPISNLSKADSKFYAEPVCYGYLKLDLGKMQKTWNHRNAGWRST
jgi:hypothetical protein